MLKRCICKCLLFYNFKHSEKSVSCSISYILMTFVQLVMLESTKWKKLGIVCKFGAINVQKIKSHFTMK